MLETTQAPRPQITDAIKAHRRISRSRARALWKHRHKVIPARVAFEITDRSLEISMRIRQEETCNRIQQAFMLPPPQRQNYRGFWTDLEVLHPQGINGFLCRLVRRGFHHDRQNADDIAELVFRICHELATFTAHTVRVAQKDPALSAIGLTKGLTPTRFTALFRMASRCTVTISGEVLFIDQLYRGGTVYRTRPDEPAEQEVIDIN